MNAEEQSKLTRKTLSKELRKVRVNIGGSLVPLLSEETCEIFIQVNNGEIAKIRANIKA